MKIQIIGGGPAGLYFAILMKKRDASADITVWERNPADNTWGWGLVFSGKTMANLEEHDAPSYASISEAFQRWDNVDVIHRGEKVTIRGNRFAGIARIKILRILQRRCEELGIPVRYNAEVEDPRTLKDCDLLVGADGVNSVVRGTWESSFAPSIELRTNRYIWLGTPRLFHGLTLIFREGEAGTFAAHAYKFSSDRSTFIVECPVDMWERTGFESLPVEEAMSQLEGIFADDLRGEPLLSNNSSWIQFPVLKNSHWHHENVVLMGDALHTAHFSIGSGTKLAMEDAIALAECFDRSPEVPAALALYEESRRPRVGELQEAAEVSMAWFENYEADLDRTPLDFAYRVMTRSTKVDHENLRLRDPEFVASWEREQAG